MLVGSGGVNKDEAGAERVWHKGMRHIPEEVA